VQLSHVSMPLDQCDPLIQFRHLPALPLRHQPSIHSRHETPKRAYSNKYSHIEQEHLGTTATPLRHMTEILLITVSHRDQWFILGRDAGPTILEKIPSDQSRYPSVQT